MITLQTALAYFLTACGGFTCVCVAVGWLIKIVKAVKKPSDEVKDKLKKHDELLDNDNKRIKKVEDDLDYIKRTQTQTLQALLVILDELKKNNDVDGVIQKTESDMQSFLLSNR
jgi:septal ring factor EnvC (AmiA/AmiB activator)